ncbi:MAG TPA: DinB family protein [Candidatus Limnocylindrales bacterium]|nr:DinB family protein [Candidatus Limnocylindrales bacterium]
MMWTAPPVIRPEIVLVAPEVDHLGNMLEFHRATLLYKCAGLDQKQLVLAPLPFSNLSLLGLVRHLSKVERVWFRSLFREQVLETLYSTPQWRDADFEDLDESRARADYESYLEETELARQAVESATLDTSFTFPDGDVATLRYVHLQVIAEYARHNGHADLLRQAIDGATGV